MKHIVPLFLLLLLFIPSGCGSMEPIKGYTYSTTKYQLEKAVLKLLRSNDHIIIDTAKVIIGSHVRDSAAYAEYLKGQVKIKIMVGEIENDYTFRYSGNEAYWKTSKSSTIFIQKATDKFGNSLYQGQNDNGEFKSKLAKDFTSLFEREVVSKIDEELKLKHTIN